MLPLRVRQSVKPKDPKKYTAQPAKVIALEYLSPTMTIVNGNFRKAVYRDEEFELGMRFC